MAEAIIKRLMAEKRCQPEQIYATNRSNQARLTELEQRYGIQTTYDLQQLLAGADMIIFAVKPKDADAVLKSIRPFITENSLFLSVLAGISISFIEKRLPENSAVARVMPNTSASVGKSATAITFNHHITRDQQQLALNLLSAIGMTVIVEEAQLNAITGLAGSGPAYIYYLVEAMEQAAKDIGLDNELAKSLVIQTLSGAAEMLATSKQEASDLRKAVTSPGGTTEAGIGVLEQKAVKAAVIDCIKTATNRAEELGQLLESKHIHSS